MDEKEIEDIMEEHKRERQHFLRGLLWGFIIMLGISTLLILGLRLNGWPRGNSSHLLSTGTQEKIHRLHSIIDEFYYEEVSIETIENGIFAGMFRSLEDPYSQYYTAEEYRVLSESTSGTYYGVGAVLSQNPETMEVTILRVYGGSPAEEAGLKAEDIIVQVGDIVSTSMELTRLVQNIRGEEGTSVHLIIYRESIGETLEFDVTRRAVEVPTVEHFLLENGDGGLVGMIQISEFSQVTHDQFVVALTDLMDQGISGLIIDLRNNPGGLISSVVDVLEDMLPAGLLVYTEDKHGNRVEYNSDGENYLNLPMVTLINGNSASASEIFAGAVKDFGYGTLIGTTSFGKGIVQQIIPLNDGSAVKVTTARYFTPNGNFIHEVGIAPDIELEYEYLNEEDTQYDPMHDNQVLRALEYFQETHR